MSRKANPWDNAACESFLKTLKYEEVYHTEYRDLAEARASIGAFLERVCNQKACTRRLTTCHLRSSSASYGSGLSTKSLIVRA